jgi:hypothetical protein
MRLRSPNLSESKKMELDNFAKWLLSIGDGTLRVVGPQTYLTHHGFRFRTTSYCHLAREHLII